jgi:hypothetical protein
MKYRYLTRWLTPGIAKIEHTIDVVINIAYKNAI